jgi:Xaa-Pro aminopeptidase
MENNKEKIENIKAACKLTDECFSHMTDLIKPGVTEKKLASEIKKFFTARGFELSFPTIAVSGSRGSEMHGKPSTKKIASGELLTLDFGCKVNGYCSDMTRTVAIGGLTRKQKEVYKTVYVAQTSALAEVCAGARCKAIDKIARDIIVEAGYGDNFIHGTGHGVSKKIHDVPTINQKSDETLREGDVITIEPGIYIEGELGVRIEDTVLVTRGSYEILTHSPKGLMYF